MIFIKTVRRKKIFPKEKINGTLLLNNYLYEIHKRDTYQETLSYL